MCLNFIKIVAERLVFYLYLSTYFVFLKIYMFMWQKLRVWKENWLASLVLIQPLWCQIGRYSFPLYLSSECGLKPKMEEIHLKIFLKGSGQEQWEPIKERCREHLLIVELHVSSAFSELTRLIRILNIRNYLMCNFVTGHLCADWWMCGHMVEA